MNPVSGSLVSSSSCTSPSLPPCPSPVSSSLSLPGEDDLWLRGLGANPQPLGQHGVGGALERRARVGPHLHEPD